MAAYAAAASGKDNLYKLFVIRVVQLLAQGARLGFITPMAVLGDLQALKVRRALLAAGAFTGVETFPQKDDPARRVFREAKLSTAVFTFVKGADAGTKARPFVSRVHPAQYVEEGSPSLNLSAGEIPLYDPANLTIVSCAQSDWDLAARIMRTGRVGRLRDYAEFFQGEVNETNARADGHLLADGEGGQLVTRGAGICLYVPRPASQGTDLYLNVPPFTEGKGADTKAFHHRYRRIGWQESCPQNNFRRIIAAMIPRGEFCNHKINYLPEHTAKLPLEFVLGLFNSKLADWYFRLGSTNNAVSHYQLYNLPCPIFGDMAPADRKLLDAAVAARRGGDLEKAWAVLQPALAAPPFSPAVRDFIVELVLRITQIEAGRGTIARTERSHLDPQAQPYQDCIDRLFYAMAGLTPDEAQGLEERLSRML